MSAETGGTQPSGVKPLASILVIDDEENLRRTMALILKHAGYQVTTAASLAEARLRLQADSFDLAFLDLKLPDGSGLNLLPELTSTYPDMPVLVLTAHDKLESATEAIRGGAVDYLLKPADPTLILQRVKEVLAEAAKPRTSRKRYSHLKKLLRDERLDRDVEPGGKKDV